MAVQSAHNRTFNSFGGRGSKKNFKTKMERCKEAVSSEHLPNKQLLIMKEQAYELINFGNSREKAEGFGMMRVIEAIDKIIEIEGEDATDGEIVDLIYELINN